MWGHNMNSLRFGNLRFTWGCAVTFLSLITTGVLFIQYHPGISTVMNHGYRNLLLLAHITVFIGFAIAIIELKGQCELRKQKQDLEQAKKVRHEYRRHIQNVQALLYVEAYSEVNEYALSLENELKAL